MQINTAKIDELLRIDYLVNNKNSSIRLYVNSYSYSYSYRSTARMDGLMFIKKWKIL